MSGPFTIFHIDGERSLRGGQRQLLYLAAQLRAWGHRNIVVCRAGAPLDEEAGRRGFDRLHLPFLGEWDPLSALILLRSCRGVPGALLHAHTGHAASLACLASRLGGPAWVAHRRVDFRLSGRLSARLKYGAARKVIAVSRDVRRILVEDGLDSDKVEVIADCLPVTAEEARIAGRTLLAPPTAEDRAQARLRLGGEWGLPPDAPWIGNLAALVPHKDHETLVRAAKGVLRERPAARFVLVGAGPLEAGLKSLAAGLGIAESVRFTGFSEDPVAWLRALDLFVLSSWGEGMGSVLLEAMACGLPVVATSAGGIPDVVSPGRTGLLVPPRDPERLARAVLEALADPEGSLRRSRAAAGDLGRFSLGRCARQTLQVYEAALKYERLTA